MISELRRAERRRRAVWNLAALAGAGLAVSCAVFAPEEERPTHPLAFNHPAHGESGPGIGCVDCHAPQDDGKRGMPKLSFCTDCHEDEENPKVKQVIAGLEKRPEGSRWVLYSPNPEVIFSHAAHAKQKCAACHGDVKDAKATGPWVAPKMETCVACHRKQAPKKNDCADCHRERRQDVAPPSHRRDWKREHGVHARFGSLDTVLQGDCAYCHKRNQCLECHKKVEPRDHNEFFRIRGHGLMASNDRNACSACHQPDMCIRCHASTRPLSHRGSFGSPNDTHCLSCHLPLSKDQSCAVCHKSTPSHAQAPARTARHAPGLNCRQCHGAGTASLPHADNGTDCLSCHR